MVIKLFRIHTTIYKRGWLILTNITTIPEILLKGS